VQFIAETLFKENKTNFYFLSSTPMKNKQDGQELADESLTKKQNV